MAFLRTTSQNYMRVFSRKFPSIIGGCFKCKKKLANRAKTKNTNQQFQYEGSGFLSLEIQGPIKWKYKIGYLIRLLCGGAFPYKKCETYCLSVKAWNLRYDKKSFKTLGKILGVPFLIWNRRRARVKNRPKIWGPIE